MLAILFHLDCHLIQSFDFCLILVVNVIFEAFDQ